MYLLRTYRSDDLDQMVALDTGCFAPEFAFDRDAMRQFAEAGNALVCLAEAEDGVLAGFVIAHIERVGSRKRGYLVTLDVAPADRRTGMAGVLMQRVEEGAASSGARWMDLHVSVDNEAAIRFYEGRGYRRLDEEQEFYGPGLDAYMYRKQLHVVE